LNRRFGGDHANPFRVRAWQIPIGRAAPGPITPTTSIFSAARLPVRNADAVLQATNQQFDSVGREELSILDCITLAVAK